jgi:hypothetical protein
MRCGLEPWIMMRVNWKRRRYHILLLAGPGFPCLGGYPTHSWHRRTWSVQDRGDGIRIWWPDSGGSRWVQDLAEQTAIRCGLQLHTKLTVICVVDGNA